MKILPNLIRGLGCVCFLCAAAMAFACDRIPAGETLWIRLTAPITTYSSKPGDAVHAVLTENLVCDDEVVLPMGAPIDGVVRSRRKVGLGFVHETAALEIEFTKATARPGISLGLTARVEEVENAREKVRNGVILGIRATATVQGTANSRLKHWPTWNPYSDYILLTYAATFPIFPEPEIYYPAGTDIRLQTTKEIPLPPGMAAAGLPSLSPNPPESDQPEEDSLRQLVAEMPTRATNTRHVEADLINMAFLGSETQVKSAFRIAGWNGADSHGPGAWAKNFYALLNNSGYPKQPMMKFLLDGKPEDMKWQRNLNSYGHRDHLRLWQWTGKGAPGPVGSEPVASKPVWAGSCTHDDSAAFNFRHFRFMHHVAPRIDDERSTVVRALTFTGCVKSVSYVPRPDPITSLRSTMGEVMFTDGTVAVVTLQDCRPVFPQADLSAKRPRFKPGNYAYRYLRHQVLGYRNDIFRANFIYGAYALGRVTVKALRPKPPIVATAKSTPPPTHTHTRTAVAATR